MASSRLPSRMSTLGAMSGSLAVTLSRCGGKKWIIRDGRKGISRRGWGAPTASGEKKSLGLRTGPPGLGAGSLRARRVGRRAPDGRQRRRGRPTPAPADPTAPDDLVSTHARRRLPRARGARNRRRGGARVAAPGSRQGAGARGGGRGQLRGRPLRAGPVPDGARHPLRARFGAGGHRGGDRCRRAGMGAGGGGDGVGGTRGLRRRDRPPPRAAARRARRCDPGPGGHAGAVLRHGVVQPQPAHHGPARASGSWSWARPAGWAWPCSTWPGPWR